MKLPMMNEPEHFTNLEKDWLRSEIDMGWQEAELGIFVECIPETIIAKARSLEATHQPAPINE